MKFALEMVENIVGKGENSGDQHFLRLQQCCQKTFFHLHYKLDVL